MESNEIEINIKTIFNNDVITDKKWCLTRFKYVEQFLYQLLDTLGVIPMYRGIYGLRFVDEPSVWLAPNIRTSDLQSLIKTANKEPELELRIRFRVTNLKHLLLFDAVTFNNLLRQIRYDFLYTRYTNEKRDFILINNAVLGLIATDLAIYAKEKEVAFAELFNLVNPKNFAPRAAAKWQRALISPLVDKLNIRRSVEACMQKDLNDLKIGYLELFLQHVCPDYAAEIYHVVCVDNLKNPHPMDICIRFNETLDDSTCTIEQRLLQKHNTELIKINDINTISYATLRNDTVEINRLDGRPLRLKFKSIFESKSFLSLIEGYYRFMRKWHFNFCRYVVSPELNYLRSITCHGPIGKESSRIKLLKNKRIGTFLVRMCEDMSNRYIIDVIISSVAILSIAFQYDQEKGMFKRDLRENVATRSIDTKSEEGKADLTNEITTGVSDQKVEDVRESGKRSSTQALVQLLLNHQEYDSLKSLVYDIQIKIDRQRQPPLQLKLWLTPDGYDDYPLLLLSVPKEKLLKMIDGLDGSIKSVTQLPNIIPLDLLNFLNKTKLSISSNMMQCRVANLNNEKDVVVKGLFQTEMLQSHNINHQRSYQHIVIINQYQKHSTLIKDMTLPQSRLQDWLFISSPLFAKTFGLCLDGYHLIQEYFSHGQLDLYLAQNKNITEATRRTISYQLAHALLFLQELQIVHGKIRCHNLFIKHLSPLQVKLSDPLGTIDYHKDRAFIPPHERLRDGKILIDQYDPGIDVWAAGTTLWQIYNKGIRPKDGQNANELIQPENCTNQIWDLIESCWILDRSFRASPQSIFRDISDTFTWERDDHNYDYVIVSNNHDDTASDRTVGENSNPKDDCSLNRSNTSRGSSHHYGSQANLLSLGSQTDVFNGCMSTNGPNTKSKKRSWKKYLLSDKSVSSQETTPYKTVNYTVMSAISSVSTSSISSNDTKSTLVTMEQLSQWQIDPSELAIGSEIGRGSSGVVFKGILRSSSRFSKVVAVKQINSSCMAGANDLRREFSILKSLDHDNIVKTYGIVDDANVMLVVEYMPLGSLLPYIKNSNRDHLVTMPLKKYALDIARGMEYLESTKIVHRDLALRNILLKNQNHAKISDFGLAHSLGANDHYKLKTERALPIRWYAPEALDTWTFTHKTDVWSYGVVLWEIYSGGCSPQYPGALANLSETLKSERLFKPKDCPEIMYRLMLSCWAYDPEDRDTFSNICDLLENLPEFLN